MNKAQYLLEVTNQFYEYEPENVPDITGDDTVIHNVTDPKLQCPTCGQELVSGVMHADRIQCPGCGHMVSDIGGSPLSGLRPRRLDLERAD